MIVEKGEDSKAVVFSFCPEEKKGLTKILYGKGVIFSLTYFFLLLLFSLMFFFLLPFRMDSGLLVLRFFILVACFVMSYIFSRALVEIVAEEDNLKFKTYRGYSRVLIDSISSIKITNYSTWGTTTITLKSDNTSYFFTIWLPSFEKERREKFSQLVRYLQKESCLSDRIKSNT